MLPFIIGGVALAATGYGVAKLLEDDCSRGDGYSHNAEEGKEPSSHKETEENSPLCSNIIEIFENTKAELYRVSLKELQTALGEIKGFKKDLDIQIDTSKEEYYNFTTISDETKEIIAKYVEILQQTQKYINDNLDTLDTIIISSNDFATYSDEDKVFVESLVNLCVCIDKATKSKMTLDGETIGREVQRAFGKLQQIVN